MPLAERTPSNSNGPLVSYLLETFKRKFELTLLQYGAAQSRQK